MTVCLHNNYACVINVVKLISIEHEAPVGYNVDIAIKCSNCGVPFAFINTKPGYSADGTKITLPVVLAPVRLVKGGSK